MGQPYLFTKLPREIRDEIYNYIWLGTRKIEQRYKRKTYIVTYDMDTLPFNREIPTDKAAWLLTSRQMLAEGMYQLCRKATWHFYDNDYRTHPADYVFLLNTPSLAMAHHLNICPGNSLHYKLVGEKLTLHPRTRICVDAMTGGGELQSQIKSLRITMWRREAAFGLPYLALNLSPGFTFDISDLDPLVTLVGLKDFRFRIVFDEGPHAINHQGWTHRWLIPHSQGYARIQNRMWTFLQPELSRLGNLLIPAGAELNTPGGAAAYIFGNSVNKYLDSNIWNPVTVWRFSVRDFSSFKSAEESESW